MRKLICSSTIRSSLLLPRETWRPPCRMLELRLRVGLCGNCPHALLASKIHRLWVVSCHEWASLFSLGRLANAQILYPGTLRLKAQPTFPPTMALDLRNRPPFPGTACKYCNDRTLHSTGFEPVTLGSEATPANLKSLRIRALRFLCITGFYMVFVTDFEGGFAGGKAGARFRCRASWAWDMVQ